MSFNLKTSGALRHGVSLRVRVGKTPGSLRRGELQGDVVGVAELQDEGRSDVLDGFVLDAKAVEMVRGGVQVGLAVDAEGDVVKADTILVEPVAGHRT
jgi:hypothetical protein